MADEENLPEEERPSWLPEKFESPEALAASYSEAERRLTELSQQNKALNDNYEHLSQQFEEFTTSQNQPAPVDPADANAQLYAMYENDPIATQALLAQQAARAEFAQLQAQQQPQTAQQQAAQAALVAQYATNELRGKYDDFDAERERISEVIEKNPRFQNDNLWADPATATQALDEAYRLVKADDLLSGKLPAQPAYDANAAKRSAQTATGGNPRPDTPDQLAEAWNQIKNADVGSYTDLMSGR